MNISDWIKRHAVFSPDKVALRTVESTYTYTEFEAQIEATACALKWELGVGVGDRVAFLSYNCPEFLITLFACARIGALFVPLNWRLTVPEHLYILQNAGVKALLLQDAFATLVEPVAEALPDCQIVALDFVPDGHQAWDELLATARGDERRQSETPYVDLRSPVLIVYTSGTTGYPKGAVHTQNAVLWNTINNLHLNDLTSVDHILTVLPLFHVGGFNVQTLPAFYCGATVTLQTGFDPEQTLAAISAYEPTMTHLVPSMMRACIESPLWHKTDFSSLRTLLTGTTIIPQALCDAFRRKGVQVAELYGATETCPIAIYKRPDYPRDKPTSIGVPALNCTVRVVDSDGNDQPVGEVGEILIKGPNVMLGYWQNEAATTQALRNGWYHTGDMGYCDSDGYYFISGRKKNLIIKGGENIYPAEVERLLNSHPDIQESAVVGMPDERWQEIPVAVLVAKEKGQLGISDVRSYLSDRLAAYKIPHRFVLTDALPKNALGKLQHFRVREELIERERDRREIKAQVEHEAPSKWLDQLDTMSDDERRHALLSYLQSHIGAQLVNRDGVDQIEASQTLIRMGLDSLMAVDIRNELQKKLDITVPLTLFLANTTLAQLVEYIDQEVQETEASPEPDLSVPQTGKSDTEGAELVIGNITEEIVESYPLSEGQRGLWFDSNLSREGSEYNLSTVVRIGSLVDLDALRTAFQHLVNRHPALRSTFSQEDGEPVQQVHRYQAVSFTQVDVAPRLLPHASVGCGDFRDEETLQAEVIKEHQRLFSLEQGPLFRVHLFTRRPDEHLLLLSWHHLVIDGTSVKVIINELPTLYQSARQQTVPGLPPVQSTYAEYVAWQQRKLESEEMQRARAYWHEQLAGELPLLNLPTDRPHPPVRTEPGARHVIQLPAALVQALRRLARQSGVTLYSLLLAAYQVFLHRYTGQDDLLVGSVTAGRNRPEFAEMVGYFALPVAIRATVTEETPFCDFLQQTHQTVLDVLAHQDYPFALLVEELQPPRIPGRPPIFQTCFALQKMKNGSNTLGRDATFEQMPLVQDLHGLRLSKFVTFQDEAEFDLFLELSDVPDGLEGVFKYSAELFEPATIERMAGHFETLLAGIVAAPSQLIAKLPLLTEPERHQLLVEWNGTKTDYASDACIHQLFEQQVARTPEAIAVRAESEQLTYHELNARANQLAHHLIALGTPFGSVVGLYVERSLEMVVGVLGILKAGCAYVPIDTAYPPERIEFMLQDSASRKRGAVSVLLTEEHLLAQLSDANEQRRDICVDRDGDRISQQPDSNPVMPSRADQLAYIIYTSGSSGRPKGVMVSHANVTRLFAATEMYYHFHEQDVWTLFHSIAFDFSVWELWGALLYGGRLVVVPYMVSRSPEAFYDLLCREQVTVLNQTPSAFRQLIAAEERVGVSENLALRLVIFGGEALELASLRPWFSRHGSTPQLVNMYGITETTVHVTYRPLTEADLESTASYIGRPIPDLQLYILDQHLQPVPIGVAGELCVGGAGVSQGYLNRPELTNDRFIDNPYAPGKLYRSGDLARYILSAGKDLWDIEYLGRIDHQVKIRGFRIELGEIKAVLNSEVGVREGVVVVREEASGKRLVAYVVGDAPAEGLRAALSDKLPDYMIPAAFVELSAMPLTHNGKIDRRALPAPDFSVDSAQLVLPRTPHETILAAIWQEILGLEQVGIHDNFFEIGGHSLLATQVVSRIRQTLQVELPLRRLFSTPTIVELAEKLTSTESALPPIEPVARPLHGDLLPLSFAQQRLWFLAQFEGMSNVYNIPLALRLSGPLDVAALSASWQSICERHEALRTTFPQVDGQVRQQINPSSGKLDLIDLSDLPIETQDAEVARLSLDSAMHPFDLTTGPLWRVTLLRLSEKEHVLLLTMHHIISDGWSINVLMRELSALVRSARSNDFSRSAQTSEVVTTSLSLPELPVQYADFALWQREWLTGAVLQGQLEYWKAQLADAPPLLTLPTDHPRPAVQSYRGERLSFKVPDALSKELKRLSGQSGTTLFMTLQAAFAVLLSRYSGQEDILIGTPIASRQVAEVEGLIGFFVNTLVLRNDLSAENGSPPTFRDLLTRVRRVALDAYQHQAVPFELLVDTLQPSRSLSHSPLFQVMFSLENNRREALSIPGITVTPLDLQYPIAKFDLTLFMEQHGESLIASWEYNTDLFERTTIERMTGNFQTLLEGIVANPNQPIAHLPLLTQAERHQLLVEWNECEASRGTVRDTQVDYPSDKCIHQLFEQQVARTPEAIAVVLGNQQLTYHELNSRANQLAHYLIAQGVGPDVLVGICVERSVEMVVGLLGILKAGGAYVPLDPSYPPERLAFMLEDAQVPILLTQQQFVHAQEQAVKLLSLDSDWPTIAAQSTKNPPNQASESGRSIGPDSLAYVIYTSGSTGRPKGVMVPHRGINRLVNNTNYIEIRASDRIAQASNASFDAATFEIWGALLHGACLVGIPHEVAISPPRLALFLQRQEISILFLTTALFNQVVSLAPEAFSNLRYLLFGGEAVDPVSVRKQLDYGAPEHFLHVYGPTENTTYSSWYPIKSVAENATTVPIGRAIANSQIYILDGQLEPVPVGVPGELYLGGDGLALGYLNRPKLTDERFIANPFGPGKLYKTGDLCRYLPDGNIEFVGRADYQVKIRGFRIELGEIEAHLRQCVGVRQAVVVVRDEGGPSGPGKRLVAYVTFDDDMVEEASAESLGRSVEGLRAALSQQLPNYMIPSAFVPLEAMPLTPNGKIDRRALPAPDVAIDEAQLVLPRTPTEEIVATIWREVLGLSQIGIHDNFFEVGGHSLLAAQVINRSREALQVEVPLSSLFSDPTIAASANLIDQLGLTQALQQADETAMELREELLL